MSIRTAFSHSRLASGIQTCVNEDEEAGQRHLLLFVSALIPKAFASILTSLVLELSKPENVSAVIHVIQ